MEKSKESSTLKSQARSKDAPSERHLLPAVFTEVFAVLEYSLPPLPLTRSLPCPNSNLVTSLGALWHRSFLQGKRSLSLLIWLLEPGAGAGSLGRLLGAVGGLAGEPVAPAWLAAKHCHLVEGTAMLSFRFLS